MIKKIALPLLLFLCMVLISPAGIFALDTDVIENNENGIPDQNLYQSILQTLGKGRDDTFSRQEAESITELFVGYTVESLQGIGYLSQLKDLEIFSNSLKNLQGVEALTKLISLKVGGNGSMESLDALSGLKSLEELHLEAVPLKDLQILEGLENLKYLIVPNCYLTSLRGVENLVKMEGLDLSQNSLQSLKELKNLTQMRYLYANQNRLTSLKGIEKMTKLEKLFIYHNQLTSLKGVEKLKKLQRLFVFDNRLTDIQAVSGLKNLMFFDAASNRLKKLPNMRKLRQLQYDSCNLEDNRLSEQEIRKKLPAHFFKKPKDFNKLDDLPPDKKWLKTLVECQNINHTMQFIKPKGKKISQNTKQIEGRLSEKRVKKVELYNLRTDMTNQTVVKVDKNGKFQFKNLKLKPWAGDEATIVMYVYCPSTKSYAQIWSGIRLQIKK